MKKSVIRFVFIAGLLGVGVAGNWQGKVAQQQSENEASHSGPQHSSAEARAARLMAEARKAQTAISFHTAEQAAIQTAEAMPTSLKAVGMTWRTPSSGAAQFTFDRPLPKEAVRVRGVPAHPRRVLVRIKPGAQANEWQRALKETDTTAIGVPNAGGWLAVDLPEADGDADAESHLLTGIKALQGSGAFASAEPDYLLSANAPPSDEGFTQGWLWGLRNTGQDGGTADIDVGALAAWEQTTGSTDIIVAVIDTGIRYTHQDLAGQMWINEDEIAGNGVDDDNDGYIDNVYGIDAVNGDGDPMDDNNHGTHCAGTIGARANDGNPHVGVAWQVRLMGCKFLSGDGWGYTSGAVECVDFAVRNGAKILSNSWGGGGFSQSLYDAISRAQDAGVLFVAAAGNSGTNTDYSPHYPSGYDLDNVVSVAAIDRRGDLASWSNYGASTVDLGAPGVDIFSCVADSDESYTRYSGTSMATPHVAGVAALLMAHDDQLSLSDVKARLLNTSRFADSLTGRTVSGGFAHAGDAIGSGPDDELELVLTISEDPLRGGRTAALMAAVSDIAPVTGAVVAGDADGTPLQFADDGVAPDATANDGTYTATVDVTDDASVEEVLFTVTATASDKAPITATLTVPVIHPPLNDNFADRAELSGRRANLIGFHNRAATAEDNEPNHYYWLPAQRSVWFTYRAPRSGRADLWLRGSDFDTVLAVYHGHSLDRLRRVARDDDSGGRLTSRARFWVRRGRVYHFAVDGYNGAEGEINGRLVVRKHKPFNRSKRWWDWR